MYCNKCGTENKSDARYCVGRGEKLSFDVSTYDLINEKENIEDINKENSIVKSKKIVLIVIGVIIGIVILIVSINGIRNAILAKQISDDFAALGDLAEENLGDVHFDYAVPEYGITYEHDTLLDVQPAPGVTGGGISTERAIGNYMDINDWISNFSVYNYKTGVFNICDEISVKTLVFDFGLDLDDNSQTQYDSTVSCSDGVDITLVDNKSYGDTEIDKLEISADYKRNVSDLTSGEKMGCDFIVNEISARDYYVESPDNDLMIANLRIGQSVSGKTFDEFGSPTGIIVRNSDFDDTYYEYTQDAFDNSVDGDTVIVYYLSEPEKVTNWGMENFYMASFQISANTKKIKSMKLAYVESCGFGMLLL